MTPRDPDCLNSRTAAWSEKKTPLALTAKLKSHSDSLRSSTRFMVETPALAQSRSNPPIRPLASANTVRVCSALVTSSPSANDPPPTPRATLSAAVGSRSVMQTVAPSRASARTIAAPMPLPPPVTTALRPASRPLPSVTIHPLPGRGTADSDHKPLGLSRRKDSGRRQRLSQEPADLGDMPAHRLEPARHLERRMGQAGPQPEGMGLPRPFEPLAQP